MKFSTKLLVSHVVAGTALLFAYTANAEIAGSAHDFSADTWNASGEICVVCHAPHNNNNSQGNLLWNHAASTATYTLYDSPTMNATDPTAVNAGSKVCLSCHDGTVAIDSFGGATGTQNIGTGAANVGGGTLGGGTASLVNDHPVSILYNATLATTDGGLANPTTANSGLGGTITADLLYSNNVECSSCHDVHNKYGVAALLKKSNAASALCLTCHTK